MSKNPTSLERQLTELDFTPDEARIYLSALRLGSSTMLQLSRETGVKRSTLYGLVERLIARGLGSWEETSHGKRFMPVPPEQLVALVRERAERVQKLVPDLLAVYRGAPARWNVRFVEGKAGVRGVYEELLLTLRPKDPYFAVTDVERWEALDRRFFREFVERRELLGLRPQILVTRSEHANKRLERDALRTRLLPKGVVLDTNLVIVPDRVILHQLSPPNLAVVLASPAIVEMHRNIFHLLWESVGSK